MPMQGSEWRVQLQYTRDVLSTNISKRALSIKLNISIKCKSMKVKCKGSPHAADWNIICIFVEKNREERELVLCT